jgi:hypothetical protein
MYRKEMGILALLVIVIPLGTILFSYLSLRQPAAAGADTQNQTQTTDTIPVKVTYYFTSGLTYCEEKTANGLVALSPDLMVKYKCGDSILLEVPNTHFNGYYIISDMTAKGKVNTVDVYLNIDKGVWRGNIIKK